MRVLHVAVTTSGGAGRGLIGLHRGLLGRGVDSRVLTVDGPSPDCVSTRVHVPRISRALTRSVMRADRLLFRMVAGDPKETFHMPWIPTAVPELVRRVDPDIIHLHWLRNLMTARQIANLGSNYRTVWTIRDLAPITGGCHYTHGCERYVDRCGHCPLIPRGWARDPTYWTHTAKLNAAGLTGITPVALSRRLAREISRSPLFAGRKITVIHPGVDASVFVPHETRAARLALSLPEDELLVGFVAMHPFLEARKGWRHLAEAVNILDAKGLKLRVVVTATAEDARGVGGLPNRWLAHGHVTTDHALSMLYSACDAVVVPSTQEAFGKVAVEALLCGTRVVGFRDTGVEDAVDHRATGYLAVHSDSRDLAAGIEWAIRERQEPGLEQKRAVIQQRFGIDSQAEKYASLYSSLSGI